MSNLLDVPTSHLHIGGELRTAGSAGVHVHHYAPTGEPQSEVPLGGPAEIDAAVAAARAAYRKWSRIKPAVRRDHLSGLAQLIGDHSEELARLSVLDNGMPIGFAQFSVGVAQDWTAYYAGWADKIEGAVVSTHAQRRDLAYTMPEPYGVIGNIITWNGPLISLGMKLLPALAAGNTVVLKPSELTPYAVEYFMSLIAEAGIPPGVVNLVTGDHRAGQALVRHPDVAKISFTGGPATARAILADCAIGLKPAVLELGGKSACLIFPDADIDAAVWLCVTSVLKSLAGQGCAMATRLIVHQDIYDTVIEKLLTEVAAVRLGDPFDPATESGPVVTEQARQRILAMIARARTERAGELLAGGGIPTNLPEGGYYVEPTVFGDVDPASEIAQTEVFGPVLSVMPFATDEDAIAKANATKYGLASYVWSNDLKRVHRLIGALNSGGVYVNGAQPVLAPELPFGGLGISGYGREGGREGLVEFLRTKSIAIA